MSETTEMQRTTARLTAAELIYGHKYVIKNKQTCWEEDGATRQWDGLLLNTTNDAIGAAA